MSQVKLSEVSSSAQESWLDLSGKVALVTGGARGIGLAITTALTRAGVKTIAADVNFEGELPSGVIQASMDVTQEEDVRRVTEEMTKRYGALDILVNNAGTIYKDLVEYLELSSWNKVVDVNLNGPTICTKVIAPVMKRNRWGRIINISSVQAYLATPQYSAYSATKAALAHLTKVWAAELAAYNITVNALCPSYVRTPMMERTIAATQEAGQMTREEAISSLVQPIPQKRLLEPEEIGFWVTILCSEMARGLTGSNIAVSGGWVMH